MIRGFVIPCMILLALSMLAACQVGKRISPSTEPDGSLVPVAAGPPVYLRVALAGDATDLTLTCTGPWRVSVGLNDPSPLRLSPGQSLVVRGDRGRALGEVIDHSGRQSASRVGEVLVFAPMDPGDRMLWDGRSWRGSLLVETAESGGSRLRIINLVELEDYLKGVVPMEMGRGKPPTELAALAAQAVAARTYAIARMNSRRQERFDLFADVRDQVYGGAEVEDSTCTLAVAMTAGLVLRRRSDLTLAEAFYHSTCAGHTAAIEQVWPVAGDPLLRGVGDWRRGGRSWCQDSRFITWRERWSWEELERILTRTLPVYLNYVARPARASWAADAFEPARPGLDGIDPGRLLDLRIAMRSSEGRVAILEITTEVGRYRVRADQTRRVLQPASGNPPIMRSAWFDLEVDRGRSVQADGRGWGHGIGMCQMGALERARHGQSVQDILAHYYPGSVLTGLTGEVLP